MNWLNFANSIPVPEIRVKIYDYVLVDNGDAVIGLRPKIELKDPEIKLASPEKEGKDLETEDPRKILIAKRKVPNRTNEQVDFSTPANPSESSSGTQSVGSYAHPGCGVIPHWGIPIF